MCTLKIFNREDRKIMNTLIQDPVAEAQAIKKFFDGLCIGYNGSSDCHCVVGPEPFFISQSDHAKLLAQGRIFQQWFSITNQLCARAYRDPSFRWFAEIIEGDVNADAVKVHRRAYADNIVTLPVLARADMVDLGVTVEVQVPGSGWGYMTAIYSTVDGHSIFPGPFRGMGEAIRTVAGSIKSPSAYILYNDPFFREVEYFCSRCQKEGIPLEMYFKRVPKPQDVKFVRRPPLEDLVSYQGAGELIEAHFQGDLAIEPNLSLLYDQKVAAAFPFDPRLKDEYPDEVRTLFPETYLIQEEVEPCFEGQTFSWQDIVSLSRNQRQFIVKFAGAKKGMRAGGKAVYNLSDCNLQQAEQIIAQALADWRNCRELWMIQRRVKKKFDVTFLDPESQEIVTRPYYAMFRPMYLFPYDGTSPSIIDHCALFRKEWKVHGSSDAVNLPVEISK